MKEGFWLLPPHRSYREWIKELHSCMGQIGDLAGENGNVATIVSDKTPSEIEALAPPGTVAVSLNSFKIDWEDAILDRMKELMKNS